MVCDGAAVPRGLHGALTQEPKLASRGARVLMRRACNDILRSSLLSASASPIRPPGTAASNQADALTSCAGARDCAAVSALHLGNFPDGMH